MSDAEMAERLVLLAWQAYHGEWHALRRVMVAVGGGWRSLSDGTQVADGPHGITVGFQMGGDPITQLVQIGFALYGARWPQERACVLAQRRINRQRWSDLAKAPAGAPVRPAAVQRALWGREQEPAE